MDPGADRLYRALLSRDPRFDGRFFTAVVTTGIYCRPVCPARTPRRENVRFYPCAAAAEAAGFRPCRRCRPETSPGTPAWVGTSATVSRALRLIREGALENDGLENLAARMGMTSRHLRRLFLRHLGASPLAVARTSQVHFARLLLDDPSIPVGRVALHAGFRSVRQFHHAIRKTFGRSPTELRRNGHARRNGTGPGIHVRLPYRPPFDWKGMSGFLEARAAPGVEEAGPRFYRRTIEVDGRAGVLEVEPLATTHALSLGVDLGDPGALLPVVERVRRMFDLGADPLRISTDLGSDRTLRPALRRGLRVPGAWDGFELTVRAILGQEVSVKAATTLAGRLVQALGEPLGSPAGGLTHLFPRPEVVARFDVERIGLPRKRAQALRALAAAVADGTLELDGASDPDDVVCRLVALPGIGEWTAQYVAMRVLREPDAFPASDLGLRRVLSTNGKVATAAEVTRRAEAWRPWRAYAALALWTTAVTEQKEKRR